jgi:hypothetical protein
MSRHLGRFETVLPGHRIRRIACPRQVAGAFREPGGMGKMENSTAKKDTDYADDRREESAKICVICAYIDPPRPGLKIFVCGSLHLFFTVSNSIPSLTVGIS